AYCYGPDEPADTITILSKPSGDFLTGIGRGRRGTQGYEAHPVENEDCQQRSGTCAEPNYREYGASRGQALWRLPVAFIDRRLRDTSNPYRQGVGPRPRTSQARHKIYRDGGRKVDPPAGESGRSSL